MAGLMKWEYKTIELDPGSLMSGIMDEAKLESLMNDLGKEGWDLVTAFTTSPTQEAEKTQSVMAVFKRLIDGSA